MTTKSQQWYKELDISLEGFPTGIEKINEMLSRGICYCIISIGDVVDRVDMYQDGQKIHYKKFKYDSLGRVIENAMYSPDNSGDWRVKDDIWYYEYDRVTGHRAKKVMRMPGASTAHEILYNKQGKRISERTIAIDS